MTTSGIGRPVVLNEEGIETLRKMLEERKRLEEENKERFIKRAISRDFTTIRLLI